MAEQKILVITTAGSLITHGDATHTINPDREEWELHDYVYSRPIGGNAYTRAEIPEDGAEPIPDLATEYVIRIGDLNQLLIDQQLMEAFNEGVLQAGAPQPVLTNSYPFAFMDIGLLALLRTAAENALANAGNQEEYQQCEDALTAANANYQRAVTLVERYREVLGLFLTQDEITAIEAPITDAHAAGAAMVVAAIAEGAAVA